MEISMTALAYELLYSLILGFLLGVAYEIIRISRVALGIYQNNKKIEISELRIIGKYLKRYKLASINEKKHSFLLAIGDILFFLFCSCVIAVFVYYFNDGQLRGFVLFGAVTGFLLYFNTLGRLLKFLSEKIVFIIKVLCVYTLFFIFFPLWMLVSKIYCIFLSIFCKISLIIIKLYDIIYMYLYYLFTKRDFRHLPTFDNL